MIENNGRTFKTKTGFCHILPDKIVLTRDGIIGNISNVTTGKNIMFTLIIYTLFAVWLLYLSYQNWMSEHFIGILFLGAFAIFFIYGILNSLNNSTVPIIERSKMKKVLFKKGITGLTRARFEMFFEDENEKIKKRLIFLPGSFSNGKSETQKAYNIMNEEFTIL